jgi:ribonuclease D
MTKRTTLLITDYKSLNAWCSTLEKYDPIAVDTEGDSLHCYFEKLCLIQVGFPDQDVLLDPLEGLDFSRLNAILRQKKIVLHGCDFDLRMLRRGIQFVPGEVFDTYIAARLVGLKEVGLASLAKQFFGIELPKSSQKANWARRPLTPAMIEYATNDTRYLLQIAERLTEELRSKGRWEWFEESCRRAVAAAAEDRDKDPEQIWKVPGSAALRGIELAVLRAVWHWRDNEAKKADRPSFQILRNEELIGIAKSAGKGEKDIPAMVHGLRRKRLEEALGVALLLPEAEWPQRVRLPRNRPNDEEERRLEEFKSRRDRVSAELQLDPGVVAPRQALERIAREPGSAGSVLMRWQQQLLGL